MKRNQIGLASILMVIFVFLNISFGYGQEYIKIPNSKFSIKSPLPEGFKLHELTGGLVAGEFEFVLFSYKPFINFYQLRDSLGDLSLFQQELNYHHKKDTLIAGYDALLIHAAKEYQTTQRSDMYFGDSTFTVEIMAYVDKTDKSRIESVENSMITIKFDKKLKIDPKKDKYFKYSLEELDFEYFDFSGSHGYIFTPNGHPINDLYQSDMIYTYLFLARTGYSLSATAIEEMQFMKKEGVSGITVLSDNSSKLENQESYQVCGNAKYHGKELYYFIGIKSNGNISIVTRAISDADNEDFQRQFQDYFNSVGIME